ncbi:MAG: hypothetical protein C0468_06060, partial [Planctomyces sp.]|nr:hypothetical protein [Planctomyces sp.]
MPIVLRWLLRLGPLNPIAVRLVQSGSRRPKHFLLRMGYLGTMMIALMWMLVANTAGDQVAYRDLAAGASNAFVYIAFLQIGLICVLAPVFMAGAIAQEADPRTWDILLTTPLGAAEIVLGNLLGRLFLILALLVSSLPLFGMTQLFGGVPGESIFASYGIAAGAATLVGTTAVALSVSRVVGRRAVFAFYVSVVSYLAVTLAADRISGGGGRVTYLTAINPFLALEALLNPLNYQRAAPGSLRAPASWFLEHPVTTWVALSLGLSVVLIALSIITVRVGGIAGVGGLGGRDSG